MKKEKFPIHIILTYILFYGGQSLYGTYRPLYFNQSGFTNAEIGYLSALGVIFGTLFQPIWGIVGDKVKRRPTILFIMFFLSGLVGLGYMLSPMFSLMMAIQILFSIVYNPVMTVMDSYSLEYLEAENSKYDYGTIRVAGTLGYAFSVYVVSKLINEAYRTAFLVASIFMGLAALSTFLLKTVPKRVAEKKEKQSFKEVLSNKNLLVLLVGTAFFSIGSALYYNYYSIYFTTFSDSNAVGTLMLVTTLLEFPLWPLAGKITKKVGYKWSICGCLFLAALWLFLLSVVKNTWAAIAINSLHGVCFVVSSNAVITYVNEVTPSHLKGTWQSLRMVFNTIVSHLLATAILGNLCDSIGIPKTFLVVSIFVLCGGFVVTIFMKNEKRQRIVNS